MTFHLTARSRLNILPTGENITKIDLSGTEGAYGLMLPHDNNQFNIHTRSWFLSRLLFHRVNRSLPVISMVMTPQLTELFDEVKVDVLPENPAQDNAQQRAEIARAFICALSNRRDHFGLI